MSSLFSQRAREAHAMAEAAGDPKDKAAFRAAAHAWEKVAGMGVAWSHKPLRRDLTALTAEVAVASEGAMEPAADVPLVRRETRGGLMTTEPRGARVLQESPSIEF